MPDTKSGAPERPGAPCDGERLTKREAGVLDYLIGYLATHTYQPSLREICTACRCKSTKTASELIQSLAEKGYVELPDDGPRPARGIRLLGVELSITRTLVPPPGTPGGAPRPAAPRPVADG